MGNPLDDLYAAARSAGGPRTPQNTDLAQVSPTLWSVQVRSKTLPPAAHTATYLWPGAVVDPAPESDIEADRLAEIVAKFEPSYIVLTHHHADHMAGAAALAARYGAPIACHPLTAQRLGLANFFALNDGDQLGAFTVLHTPGHAVGHIVLSNGADLIAGDMVATSSTILIDPSEGNMTDYLDSLARLSALRPTRVFPAHGSVADASLLSQTLTHRLRRETQILTALPGTTQELVAKVYADTPPALWPLAERSLLAHLARLVQQEHVREKNAYYTAVAHA